jgi:hypothetical protein
MTLKEMIEAVDSLTPSERRELRAYLEHQEGQQNQSALSIEERLNRLNAGFAAIVEGMTPEQIDEMVEAMNAEYIEPWDETEWQD